MFCLGNIFINTLHKIAKDDGDNNNNNFVVLDVLTEMLMNWSLLALLLIGW
jgi:hypothetical protein